MSGGPSFVSILSNMGIMKVECGWRFTMQLEDYFDFLATNDIRIRGTRVGIETVLYEFIHQSQSPEAIARRYPALTLEQVYATITYYLHNQKEIEVYLAEWLAHGERMRAEQEQNPTPAMLKLRQMRDQRVATFQAAEEHTPYEVD